jgi:hypothetical protein
VVKRRRVRVGALPSIWRGGVVSRSPFSARRSRPGLTNDAPDEKKSEAASCVFELTYLEAEEWPSLGVSRLPTWRLTSGDGRRTCSQRRSRRPLRKSS